MANLPAHHPNLTLHLVDRALTPLITSSRTQEQAQSLVSLSQTALAAHEAAQRLGLGNPQRIMVEHASNGPVLFHSFLNPAAEGSSASRKQQQQPPFANGHQRTLMAIGGDDEPRAVVPAAAGEPDGVHGDNADAPPLLVSTVLAPTSDSVLEARRASARLERVGREVQARWSELQN